MIQTNKRTEKRQQTVYSYIPKTRDLKGFNWEGRIEFRANDYSAACHYLRLRYGPNWDTHGAGPKTERPVTEADKELPGMEDDTE